MLTIFSLIFKTMNKLIPNLGVLLCLVILSISCSDENKFDSNQVQPTNRLIFNNFEEFTKTYDYLASISSKEQEEWVKQKQIPSSLLSSNNDTLFSQTPLAFQALFNNELEFQIKDSVIKYNNGNLYLISTNNNKNLNKDKSIDSFPIWGQSKIISVGANTPTTRTNVEVNGDSGLHLHEFMCDVTPINLRYIVQLRSHTITQGYDFHSSIYVETKLEYQHSRKKWYTAGEHRNIMIDISGYVSPPNNPNHIKQSFQLRKTVSDVSGNQETLLASCDGNRRVPGTYKDYWSVSASGSIKQVIIGYPESEWGPLGPTIWVDL